MSDDFAVSVLEAAGFAALLEVTVDLPPARTGSALEPMASSYDPYFNIGSSSS